MGRGSDETRDQKALRKLVVSVSSMLERPCSACQSRVARAGFPPVHVPSLTAHRNALLVCQKHDRCAFPFRAAPCFRFPSLFSACCSRAVGGHGSAPEPTLGRKCTTAHGWLAGWLASNASAAAPSPMTKPILCPAVL